MTQKPPARPPKPATLPQQKADFTAEGSPAPGEVFASVPPALPVRKSSLPRAPANVPGARKGPKQGKYK